MELDYAKRSPACFVITYSGVLPEEYGRAGSSVRLGDGQAEAEVQSRDVYMMKYSRVRWMRRRAASPYASISDLPSIYQSVVC